MKKEYIIGGIIVIIIIILGFWLFPINTTAPVTDGDPIATSTADVILDKAIANTVVTSPLTITGKAIGNWYFEASFPATLLDANGKILAQVPAQATADWMTTDYVPFSATLTFTKPTTATGTLILKNDNPSGDPIRDKSMSFPVKF